MNTTRVLVVAVTILLQGSIDCRAAETSRRNVVFILIDDLSHYGVTAYGANRISSAAGGFENIVFQTPRIDALAREGLRFSNAFAYPLCEPTRTTLMSGKYNNRNHLVSKGQHASDITFGDLFQRAGYVTGMTGKWKQTRGTVEILAKDYISEFGWDEYCCFDVIGEGRRYINPNLVINGEVVNYNDERGIDPATARRWYGPDICNRFALDFIERHQTEPFFLYYPMILVHDEHLPTPDTIPHSAFDEFDAMSRDKNGRRRNELKYFPDMIAYTDKLIGKVVDQINTLGLRDNTLIVVMGDNGTKEPFTHILPDGSEYPGGKGSTTDNGTHVPLVLSLPGTIPTGDSDSDRTYDGLVDLADIHPTLCDAAGIVPPNQADLDGISFWQQALGKQDEHRTSSYVWYNHNRPMTDPSEVLQYAFDKNFKRYGPDRYYPAGRFFDLRSDRLETSGRTKVKGPGWNKYYHSGLDIETLDTEQRDAFDRLGDVLAAHRYVAVTELKIRNRSVAMRSGESAQMTADVLPSNATRNNVIWESSDPSIVSVDKFGLITAHRSGNAVLSVYSWDDAFPVANQSPITFSRDGLTDSVPISVR
ncbi:sulfatase-like hydrolase/transferase [Aporhodopirellula aestuarii]|uniref:Sulfatase-like hydrolase/transferase n=1 Tax=Aporhodopirellula aestuarii TaxID=2950107 RepID=A0ABT0UE90_9BACT|nr:sulfatase-like hydrolase/transferase [Aporhodopirellula aestuarii]MCM2374591.1 sulfatase-like hydrolase/transferase [Aporhodopirellula aestuarii]